MAANSAVAVQVFGRVQNVGFRAWVQREAQELRLAGWVANARDGSVRALICGDPTAVATMLASLREGPPLARVDRVLTEPAEPTDAAAGFWIRTLSRHD